MTRAQAQAVLQEYAGAAAPAFAQLIVDAVNNDWSEGQLRKVVTQQLSERMQQAQGMFATRAAIAAGEIDVNPPATAGPTDQAAQAAKEYQALTAEQRKALTADQRIAWGLRQKPMPGLANIPGLGSS